MAFEATPYLRAIEQELRQLLTPADGPFVDLYAMMQYHMGWLDTELRPSSLPQGKRLRSLLCLLACEAQGADPLLALPGAAAIELVHNFSLIHDDIEDRSESRRHRPTVWHNWGIAQGVNTGDAMWAISRTALHRLSTLGHPPERVLLAGQELDKTCVRLCEGQFLDLSFEAAARVTLADYELMIAGKTAALVSASTAVGALLGGARRRVVDTYREFGLQLGLAFQIVDDILGIWGDPEVTGKSIASDILERKKSYPVLCALQWESEHHLSDLHRLYGEKTLGESDLPAVILLLERAGARALAIERAARHHRQALACLEGVGGATPARAALIEIADALLDRTA